jgi:4a-hydroxytetrahydrobiopterin dehydratase
MSTYSKEQIREGLKKLQGWSVVGKAIQRQFVFPNFMAAIQFVNKIAELAEKNNHHPDITINYKKVTLSLTTHEFSGLTERDFNAAQQIDQMT